MNVKFHNKLRIALLLSAVFALTSLGTSALHAATETAKVFLNGRVVGNGLPLTVRSGTWKISPSKLFTYEINGTCTGIAPSGSTPGAITLAQIVPPGTSLASFMESVSVGSSSYLKGQFSNPKGTLPAVLLDRRVSGSRNIRPFGKVSVSFRLRISILATGEIVLSMTNVSILSPAGKIPGTIKFGPGSKALLATAPLIRFKRPGQNVRESAGVIKIVIARWGNTNGPASADYETFDGTATAGDDYTPQKGTVRFTSGQRESVISIPITNRTPADFYREFTVRLSNAKSGAVLGEPTSITVGILNG